MHHHRPLHVFGFMLAGLLCFIGIAFIASLVYYSLSIVTTTSSGSASDQSLHPSTSASTPESSTPTETTTEQSGESGSGTVVEIIENGFVFAPLNDSTTTAADAKQIHITYTTTTEFTSLNTAIPPVPNGPPRTETEITPADIHIGDTIQVDFSPETSDADQKEAVKIIQLL